MSYTWSATRGDLLLLLLFGVGEVAEPKRSRAEQTVQES